MPAISVIIPVYNVEQFLRKCVDSVIAQTMDDIEIILVDDGSKDSSGSICDEYADKDSRIKVLHKRNGGLSDARNEGLKLASGEYVGFVDSDDYISNDMYETLYNNLINNKTDISVCATNNVYKNRTVTLFDKSIPGVYSREQAVKGLLSGKEIAFSVCNKIFKRDFFNTISFPVGKYYEDAFVIVDLLMMADSIYVCNEPKYYYVHRSKSITTSENLDKQMDLIEAHTKNYRTICEMLPEAEKEAEFYMLWSNFYIFDKLLLLKDYKNNKHYPELKRFLKANVSKVLRNKYFRSSRRAGALAFAINVHLYRLLNRANSKYLSDEII